MVVEYGAGGVEFLFEFADTSGRGSCLCTSTGQVRGRRSFLSGEF